MIDRIVNELTSLSLEILKLCMLRVLYDAGTGLTYNQIHEAVGIDRLPPSAGYNDYLIHGLLLRLWEDGLARHGSDEGGAHLKKGQWEITERGIASIDGEIQ